MKTLDKLFSIIEVLEENNGMRLQEIADSLNMNKSTIYRFISKLSEYELVKKNNESQKYALGMRFLNISSNIIEKLNLREESRNNLEKLSRITGEMIHLGMLLGNEIVYIDIKESVGSIRMSSKIGKRVPIYCTALGKTILAFQGKKRVNQILNSIKLSKRTKSTITSKKELLKEINRIRKDGYAIDREENEEDIACIAAPIKDYAKKVEAAISITVILSRIKIENIINYKDLIIKEANNISKKLGYIQ